MRKRIFIFLHFVSLWLGYYLSRLMGKNFARVNKVSNYQPLPWIGLKNSRRTQGTIDRWKKIDEKLTAGTSVLDIGCDVGYFVFKAAEKGCLAWGVDNNIYAIITANYAKEKIRSSNSQFFLQQIDESNIDLLPEFDYIIFVSVFHHWCLLYGFDKAKLMLAKLLKKAKRGLFFEMGQEEMASKYNIPAVDGDFKDWLKNFLEQVSGREAQILGEFDVFVDGGRKSAKRAMFLIS